MRTNAALGCTHKREITVMVRLVSSVHKRRRDAVLSFSVRPVANRTFRVERHLAELCLRAQLSRQFHRNDCCPLRRSRRFARLLTGLLPHEKICPDCYTRDRSNGPQTLTARFRFLQFRCLPLLYQLNLRPDLCEVEQFGDLLIVKPDASVRRLATDLARVVCSMDAVVLPAKI